MRGKVLKLGIISGNDGNRYSFCKEDITNQENPNLEHLVGLEVDFEIKEDKAVDIYVINDLTNSLKSLTFNNLKFIKIKYFIGVGLGIFNFIPVIGQFLSFIGLIVRAVAIYGLGKLAHSKTLFKNLLIGGILSAIGGAMFYAMVAVMFRAGMILGIPSVGLGVSGIPITGLVGVVILIVGFVFTYKYYAELALITNKKEFKKIFIGYVVSVIASVIVVGVILFIIIAIWELFVWKNINEINEVKKLENIEEKQELEDKTKALD